MLKRTFWVYLYRARHDFAHGKYMVKKLLCNIPLKPLIETPHSPCYYYACCMKMTGDSLSCYFSTLLLLIITNKFKEPFVSLRMYFFCGMAFFLFFKEILCVLCDTLRGCYVYWNQVKTRFFENEKNWQGKSTERVLRHPDTVSFYATLTCRFLTGK
jgi:hypothetical protein